MDSSGPEEDSSKDGLIDFSQYSEKQLKDFQYTIDRKTYPENYKNLQIEINNRFLGNDATKPLMSWAVRYTRYSGFRGWIEAKFKWLTVYGKGWIEIEPNQAVIHGWRRTWLGVPLEADVSVQTGHIRNVAQEGAFVRFERIGWKPGRFEFEANSIEQAQAILAHLPTTQAPEFDRKWSELQYFNRNLNAVGSRSCVTTAIILINIVVFAGICTAEQRYGAFDQPHLLSWGANFGPLTVNGQWWRLLTATFLHFSPLHLILNMWAFWNVGRLTERLYGKWTFLFLYVSAGVFASLTSTAWDPSRTSAGASGAIFGIFGAFLAFLAHRKTRVPSSVFRAHWFSTAAFLLFNLINGALQTGIDNSAHVGGLLTGFIFGWLLARPLNSDGREPIGFRRASVPFGIVLLISALGYRQVHGLGSQLTKSERYWRAHDWFVSGEVQNLALWQELANRAASGTISDAEVSSRFEKEIVPFWKMADKRLEDEERNSNNADQFDVLISEFTKRRLEWATAIAESNNDKENIIPKIKDLEVKVNFTAARIQRIELREGMDHRPRALSNSVIVNSIGEFFSGKWRCVRPPDIVQKRVSPKDSTTDSPAIAEKIGCDAQRAFEFNDFSSIDAMINNYSAETDGLPGGGSKLGAVIGGLIDLLRYRAVDWNKEFGLTADWRRLYPKSAAPELVEALLFQEWAWAARGGGYANTVSPQQMMLFQYRMEMAAMALQESKDHAASNPVWYELSLDEGVGHEESLEKIRKTFDEGHEKFPKFFPLYSRMLHALMPRWYGSYEKINEFIHEQYENSGNDRAAELYAELYWKYSDMEGDDINIFDQTEINWTLAKSGFREMEERYPKSDYVINQFLNFACQADDSSTYVELRPLLYKRISSTAWSAKVSIEICDKKFKEALFYSHPKR